jgi:hypothetical protein
MGYNSRELKASPLEKKVSKPKDVIYDPMGQWKYPGQVTRIPGGNITMQGVNYPVLGVDSRGNQQMMYPGMEYTFPGDYVTEYPQMQAGGSFGGKAKAPVRPAAPVRPVAKPSYSDPNALITYKNNPQVVGSTAQSLNTGNPEYDKVVQQKLLTGKYGYDPKTRMVHPLQPEDQFGVSSAETTRLSQPKKEISKSDANYEYSKTHKPVLIEDIMDGVGGNAGEYVWMTKAEEQAYNEEYARRGMEKMLRSGSNIIRSMPGIETLSDAIGLGEATLRGDKTDMGIYSAALALPFVPGVLASGLRQVKKLPETVKKYAPKYETIVRIEPSTYSAKPNPNLPDEMNALQGRWYGTPEEAAYYLKQSKDPNATHHVVSEMRLPVKKITKYKGENMPMAAKQMSIGYGQAGSWQNLAKKYNISEEKMKTLISKDDVWQNHPEHYNPNELIVPQQLAEFHRANPKLVGTPEELMHYLELLQRKVQTPYKVPILGTTIPREYLPWLSKKYPAPTGLPQNVGDLGEIGAARKINLPMEYRTGGLVRYTDKNIKSSINELMRRNELLFGPKGKHHYIPVMKKKKDGGTPEAFPQQPTQQQFFERGFVPQGPIGFYKHGGDIAFPQQPPADVFFAGIPWQPEFMQGGQPCLECGGQHMKDGGWIQDATKNMRTDKPCTGSKFGGPDCPPGSPRYNLAKTFRAMAKKQFGGDNDADDMGGSPDMDQDDYLSQYSNTFMGTLKNNTAMSLADEAAQQAQSMMTAQFGGGIMSGDYGYSPNMMNQNMFTAKADNFTNKGQQAIDNFYRTSMNAMATAKPYMKNTVSYAADGIAVGPGGGASGGQGATNTGMPSGMTQDQFFEYMDAYNQRQNQGAQQYNTPNNQQQWNYNPQGMNNFPMNYNPGMSWNTKGPQVMTNGYPVPMMAFNPQNTHLQSYDYRGRLLGPGARKVSMTFRTYTDPQTGQTTQVPVEQGQGTTGTSQGTPGYNAANPQNLQNSQPTYLTPEERQKRDQTRKGIGLKTRLDNFGQNVEEYFGRDRTKPQFINPNTRGVSQQPFVMPNASNPNEVQGIDYSKSFASSMKFGGMKAQGGIEVPNTGYTFPDYSWDGPIGGNQAPRPMYETNPIMMDQNTNPANNDPLVKVPQGQGSYFDTTVTGKRKMGLDGESSANWIMAALAGATGVANRREAAKTDELVQRGTLADNSFASMAANRLQNQGRYNWTGMSTGAFDPNSMDVVQQPGQNYNMEGQAFSKMGGAYQQGGPVELDEDEINYILQNGGSIQYLD